MKEFVLLFRMDISSKSAQPSKEQMEIYMQQWMLWISEIDANKQLADGGNHFSKLGRVLKPKTERINQPYIADKQSVAGYIIILANDMDDATRIAENCPILNGENTNVEIREVEAPGA